MDNSIISAEYEQLIREKLFEIISILEELGEARTSIKKLRNHPIHDFTDFLKSYAIDGFYTVIELELLQKDIEDVADDFKNTRNLWIKEKIHSCLITMRAIIYNLKYKINFIGS